MGSWARIAFVIVFLFSQGAPGFEPALPLTLRIYDSAGVPAETLIEAKTQIRRIFNKAGVAPLWLDCMAAEPPDPVCVQKLQPAELVARILPRTSTSHTGHLFGLALVTADGFGQYATIFYGEVQTRAKGDEVFEGCILGYAIAHEVGHLLLKNQRHAPTGIMTSGWTAKHLRSTVKQFFLFTRSEAEQLRTNLKARILATEAPAP